MNGLRSQVGCACMECPVGADFPRIGAVLMRLQVKEPAQAKLPTKLGAIQAVLGKAQKAILRNDFEFHAKTVAEVRDIINISMYV